MANEALQYFSLYCAANRALFSPLPEHFEETMVKKAEVYNDIWS